MKKKLLSAFYASIEWRIIAYFITNAFFWFTTGSFWKAAGLAFLLQIVLFFTQMFWFFWRKELGRPLFPHVLRFWNRKRHNIEV